MLASSTISSNTDSYYSSSSSSSPFPNNNNNLKSMEEVWKDINITSFPNTPLSPSPHNNHHHHHHHHHFTSNNHNHNLNSNCNHNLNLNQNQYQNHHVIHHPSPSAATSNVRGILLQDFLNRNDHAPINIPAATAHHKMLTHDFQQLFDSNNNNYSAFATFDGGLASSNSLMPPYNGDDGVKKRSPEVKNVVENRHKRMIKNRESAARSRARKQAYISELELEVTHLAQENTRLRKQQQQLLEAASSQPPKKQSLLRTLTAPF